LLYATNMLADDEPNLLMKMAEAAESGVVTQEMFGIFYEMAQLYSKIQMGDLISFKSAEADACVQNLRSFIRSVRDILERKFGLIEGIQG
ncbi:MAG: hypothetical protein N2234_05795, partial [Planctomycetota bacterium]|nr:hypothetical protein [Planctomycetota bacterium]